MSCVCVAHPVGQRVFQVFSPCHNDTFQACGIVLTAFKIRESACAQRGKFSHLIYSHPYSAYTAIAVIACLSCACDSRAPTAVEQTIGGSTRARENTLPAQIHATVHVYFQCVQRSSTMTGASRRLAGAGGARCGCVVTGVAGADGAARHVGVALAGRCMVGGGSSLSGCIKPRASPALRPTHGRPSVQL